MLLSNDFSSFSFSGRQKQLAELGLDLGSDVSLVSDPDGMSASFDLPDNGI